MTPFATAAEQQDDTAGTADVRDISAGHPGGLTTPAGLLVSVCTIVGLLTALIMRSGVPLWMLPLTLAVAVSLALDIIRGVTSLRAVRAIRAIEAPQDTDLREMECQLTRELTRSTHFTGIAHAGVFQKQSPLETAALKLAAAGAVGMTYRIVDEEQPVAELPESLDVPIEPTPLARDSTAFRELIGDSRTKTTIFRDDLRRAHDPSGNSVIWWWFVRVSLAVAALGLTVGLIMAVIDLVNARTPKAATGQILSLCFALVVMLLWRLYHPRRWTLVPGAIIVSTSTWRSTEWQLHMFRRSDSVLLYWQKLNFLVLAQTDGAAFSRSVRHEEAELALRAWRSPIPPPAIERMSDLV